MHFMETIAILIRSVFSGRVINCLVNIAPFFQTCVNVVFIGENQAPDLNGLLENGRDGLLLDIGEHVEDDLPATLYDAQDRWLFAFQCPTSRFPFESPAASFAPQLRHHFGMTLVTRDDIDLIGFDLTAQTHTLFFAAIPSRSKVVMSCTASASKDSSSAICALERFKPMKYKLTSHTRKG